MADMKTLSDGTTTYNVTDPTNDLDAATKKYVDDEIAAAIANLVTTSQMTTAIQEAISGVTLESLGGGQLTT